MSDTPHSQPSGDVIEVDASQLLDVIHKYPLPAPKTTLMMAKGSEILCAKGLPDGTIAIWARRPIAEDTPMVEIGVWCVGTGEPMPKGDFAYYLDTCMILRPASIATPRGNPDLLVWHVFLLIETLIAGEVKIVA